LKTRGFTLLEVVVAVAILALGVGASMQIFSGGLKNIRRIEMAHRAMNHAENVMNEILSDETVVAPGGLSGDLDEDFRFNATIDYWEPPTKTALQLDVVQDRIQLLSVVVDIHFKNDPNGRLYRSVCLKAISLQQGPGGLGPAVDPIRQLFGGQ